MTFRLAGVVPPMVTPLDDKEKLDFMAINGVVDHLLQGGVDGIFLLGSTGEFTALEKDDKFELMQQVKTRVGNQVPILVGVSEPGTELTLKMIKAAERYGMDGVVVSPPYYFPLDQVAVLEHYRYLSAHSNIPIILYNIPLTTGIFIERNTVEILVKEKAIAGVKDSSGDFIHFRQLVHSLKQISDCPVMQGHEALAASSLMVGAAGLVPAYANVFPQLYLNLIKAIKEEDSAKALCLQGEIDKLIATYSYGSVYGSIKAALSQKGLCTANITKPLQKPSPAQEQQIKELIAKVKLA